MYIFVCNNNVIGNRIRLNGYRATLFAKLYVHFCNVAIYAFSSNGYQSYFFWVNISKLLCVFTYKMFVVALSIIYTFLFACYCSHIIPDNVEFHMEPQALSMNYCFRVAWIIGWLYIDIQNIYTLHYRKKAAQDIQLLC